jgi:dihydroorotase
MSLVIKNGHLIDPSAGLSEQLDLRIEDGCIAAIGKDLPGDEVLDAAGCVVCPGLVDIHVHFREPGFESKETIETGSRAAARGGFTTVVTMPNTNPPIDSGEMVGFHNRRAQETACIRVLSAAAATKGRSGGETNDMAELKAAGAVAVTDDGSDVPSSLVMRRVLECAAASGLPYLAHAEDGSLAAGGAMNEGSTSVRLGLPGIPKAVEDIATDRVIHLARLTGAHVHLCHVSSAESLDSVRRAKARGLRVTCETAPHYWTLTDAAIDAFGANAKMNPPLREAEDVEAIKAGFADGTIDCIATDHAPHTAAEKEGGPKAAPFGIVGSETALGLVLTGLVEPGVIPLERAIELMTAAPARLLNLPAGSLTEGEPADICIFDPREAWTVDPADFVSKGRNTPFTGMVLRGRVRATLCAGQIVYQGC